LDAPELHPVIPIVAIPDIRRGIRLSLGAIPSSVPPMPVHILAVPTAAPWPKATEVIDFTVAVRAPHAFQDQTR
jgi:hypothetical protein